MALIPHLASATMVEALATLHDLALARSLRYMDIEVDYDSLEVIQLCSGVDWLWKDVTSISIDIVIQAGSIRKVEFLHCGRDTNVAAHHYVGTVSF
jgi:hypothetical protein